FEFSLPNSDLSEAGSAQNSIDVLEGLMALVDKSLLRQEERWGAQPRFMMLETIHEFAQQLLEEQGESEALRKRHAEFFADLAHRLGPGVMSPKRATAMALLEIDYDNIRSALEWYTTSPERYDMGLS